MIAFLGIIVLLLIALYLLFQQPGPSYQTSSAPLMSQQAAIGRAVMDAARKDPAVATMVRDAIKAASPKDQALAAEPVDQLPKQ